MQISQLGINLIKSWEGLGDGDPTTVALDPYLDSAGLPTIGWGHLIRAGENFEGGISRLRAEELLRDDIVPPQRAVSHLVVHELNQNQYDALCSFVYNVGTEAFSQSTLLKWLNEGRVLDVPQQLCRWNNAGGRKSLGLTRRRVDEARVFLTP